MNGFLDWADIVLYVLIGLQVLYLFVFAVANMFGDKSFFPPATKKLRFLAIFPAYREDRVIIDSISEFMKQDYPADLYSVTVVSDHMSEETDRHLVQLGAGVLKAAYQDSSKAKALQLALSSAPDESYDKVVILDADNLVNPDFLNRLNDCFWAGSKAIQAHRKAKNLEGSMAILDAVSEEINNSIFRRGHVALGFSSALIGSGMSFDFKWFKEHVGLLNTAGEDKELEMMLFKERVYVTFLNEVPVYDEKTKQVANFNNQRRRWLSTQYFSLLRSLPDLPGALFSSNWDYADKIVQWMMFPRIILLGMVPICCLLSSLYRLSWSIKWWALLLVLLFALAFSIPDELVNKKFRKALRYIPILGLSMFFNIFRLRGLNKKFIHTKHES
jgi:cellulose synthase/poly-beta-1,6-N-acetylglucosamine synthase-like glycosyltransferase